MKILFVSETLTYGGASRRFVDLANYLADENYSVTFFVYNGNIQIENRIRNDIEIITDEVGGINGKWFNRNLIYRYRCIKKINGLLKNSKFDLIISFNDMVNINVLLSRQARKRNIIISERSDPFYNKFYLGLIKKNLFKLADGIVFQTAGAKSYFPKKVVSKSEVIPNPIPSNVYLPKYLENNSKTIISVARFWIYQKRQDVLLKAFSEFIKLHEDYKLILYGDGPDEIIIRQLIEKLNLKDKVIIAGVSDNILEMMSKASFLVLSSDFEGIPNVLIEAMTIGLPVISTNCSPGGASFLINNKCNGLLVEKSNHVALAEGMSYMVTNPQEAKEMANKAKEIKSILNEEIIYNQWLELISSIIYKT